MAGHRFFASYYAIIIYVLPCGELMKEMRYSPSKRVGFAYTFGSFLIKATSVIYIISCSVQATYMVQFRRVKIWYMISCIFLKSGSRARQSRMPGVLGVHPIAKGRLKM
jgi:hypothetical protein